jgi:hypothetical protein
MKDRERRRSPGPKDPRRSRVSLVSRENPDVLGLIDNVRFCQTEIVLEFVASSNAKGPTQGDAGIVLEGPIDQHELTQVDLNLDVASATSQFTIAGHSFCLFHLRFSQSLR